MDAGGTNDLWHYAVGSERKGPVPRTTIAKLLASGEISAETYVWQPGMDNWVHLVDAAPLKPLVAGLEGDGAPEEFVEEDTAFTSPADLKAVHTALDDDDGELSGDTIVEAIPDMSKGAPAPAVQETGPRGTQKSPKKGAQAQAEAKPAPKVAAPAAKAEPVKAEPAKQMPTSTMAAQPAPAPAKKDSGLFPNVAAPAAAAVAANDIFGGGADDDIFGSSAPASEGEDIAGVHGRRQSSVLFSLDELGREENKKGGAGGGKPGGNEQFVTDSSGLIDIKAIATNEKRGSGGDDPFGASAPNLVLPVRSGPSAMTIPIVERKRGNGPWILAAAALLVIGGAVVAFILATGGEKEVTNVPVAASETAKTEPAKPVEVAKTDEKKPEEAKPTTPPPTEAKVDPAANPTTPPPTEAKVDPAANPTTPPPTEAKVEPTPAPAVTPKKDEPKKDVKKDEPKTEVKKDEPKKDEPKTEVKKDPPANKENTTKVNDLLDKLNSGDPVKKDETGGDSSLPDKLSAATVRNTIKGRFGRCGGMISNPSGSVTVQTQFVISASGVVQSARVSDGGGTSPDVQRCVVSVIKETTFGKFKEPTMQVNLPVRLL